MGKAERVAELVDDGDEAVAALFEGAGPRRGIVPAGALPVEGAQPGIGLPRRIEEAEEAPHVVAVANDQRQMLPARDFEEGEVEEGLEHREGPLDLKDLIVDPFIGGHPIVDPAFLGEMIGDDAGVDLGAPVDAGFEGRGQYRFPRQAKGSGRRAKFPSRTILPGDCDYSAPGAHFIRPAPFPTGSCFPSLILSPWRPVCRPERAILSGWWPGGFRPDILGFQNHERAAEPRHHRRRVDGQSDLSHRAA